MERLFSHCVICTSVVLQTMNYSSVLFRLQTDRTWSFVRSFSWTWNSFSISKLRPFSVAVTSHSNSSCVFAMYRVERNNCRLNNFRSGIRIRRARALKFDIQREPYYLIYSSKDEYYSLITSSVLEAKGTAIETLFRSAGWVRLGCFGLVWLDLGCVGLGRIG